MKYAALGVRSDGVHVAEPEVGGRVWGVLIAKEHCLSSCRQAEEVFSADHLA